jgi:dihydrofolate synthase/folylpolyglutamate synthase
LLERILPTKHPTFFEVVTVMALLYFVERQCEVVIWETGLGGRLDATNIVTPLASVITNIQLDHERWLGSTLAQIAAEKAGIIKPAVPALTAAEEPEALAVIQRIAQERQAPLTQITAAHLTASPLDHLEPPLLGEHQRKNAALAVATARTVRPQISVSESALAEGLAKVQWPGRLQRHVLPNGAIVLLDGAHNPAGTETLHQALDRYFPGLKPALILGVMQDKDWIAMCGLLAPHAKRMLLAPVHSERTASPAELEQACASLAPGVPVQACGSLGEALRLAQDEPFILITGSLHLVGEALELLGLAPEAAGERQLNEWDGGKLGRSKSRP